MQINAVEQRARNLPPISQQLRQGASA
jgi:hypothetical protein